MLFLVVVSMVLSSFFLMPESHAQNITQVEGLKRVGPRDLTTGYPLWYEDKSGLKLQLCLDPENCFLEIPNLLLPLHMPTSATDPAANFPDETFYYAAESIFSGAQKGVRAVLVQALEGMFFSDAGVIVDDQAVMSRIRIRIDGLKNGASYTVVYPYGIETFDIDGDAGPGAAKGPGISMTRDIGLVEPLFFEGPLTGDIGPFLRVHPNDPNQPPAGFIADGGVTEVTVTGSPLEAITGRNTNVFRIEGPDIGITYPDLKCTADRLVPFGPGPNPLPANNCVESFHFVLMGQIATKFGAQIDRATYTKEIDGSIFVNVWANTVEGQDLVATVDGGPAVNLTEGEAGNYFVRLSVPADPIPQTVRVTNTTDNPSTFEDSPITAQLIIKEATYIVGQGLNIAVQSSNSMDATDIKVTLLAGQAPSVDFFLTDQTGGLASGTKNVAAGIVEEQPAIKVVVRSRPSGSTGEYTGPAEANVTVRGIPTTGGLMNGILALAGVDQNVLSGRTVILNGSDSLGPINLSYAWSHDGPTTGVKAIVLVNTTTGLPDTTSAQIGFVTPANLSDPDPNISGKMSVNFTLTVSDGVNTHSDTVRVNMVQLATLAVDTCSFATNPAPGAIGHLPGAPRYRINREKWIVEGTCDLADNQLISVYLGNDGDPANPARLIGTTRVDALGNWAVSPGNRSAVFGQTIPEFTGDRDPRTPIHPTIKVYLISERGSGGDARGLVSSDFTIN